MTLQHVGIKASSDEADEQSCEIAFDKNDEAIDKARVDDGMSLKVPTTIPYLLRHPSLEDLSSRRQLQEHASESSEPRQDSWASLLNAAESFPHTVSSNARHHHPPPAFSKGSIFYTEPTEASPPPLSPVEHTVSRNSIFEQSWVTPAPYSKSKNDIFNQSWHTDGPHISSKPQPPSPLQQAKSISTQQRDLEESLVPQSSRPLPRLHITQTPSINTSPRRARSRGHFRDFSDPSAGRNAPHTIPRGGLAKVMSFGDSDNDEELQEQIPTSPATLPTGYVPSIERSSNLNLILLATKKNLIGVGGHAEVYKAKFTVPGDPTPRDCAAKRLFTDAESQRLGLTEAFMLRKLAATANVGQHSNIVEYMGIKDEADAWSHLTLNTVTASENDFTYAFNSPALSAKVHADQVSPMSSPNLSPVSSLTSPLLPPPSAPLDTGTFEKAKEEGRVAQTLTEKPRLVVLLEYCSNGSLSDWMQQHKGRIGRRLFFKWARQLALAIERVHSVGMIHTDIKPQNVLLTAALDIKLSDFGTAMFIKDSRPSMDGLGRGTGPYSAPELLNLRSTFGSSSDVFSLGVTLYVMGISGRDPFAGVRTAQMIALLRDGSFWKWEEAQRGERINGDRFLSGEEKIPEGLLELIQDMTSPAASKRPTAAKVAQRLRELDGPTDQTPPASEDPWGYHGVAGGQGFFDEPEEGNEERAKPRQKFLYL